MCWCLHTTCDHALRFYISLASIMYPQIFIWYMYNHITQLDRSRSSIQAMHRKEKKESRPYNVPAWMWARYPNAKHDKSCCDMRGYASFSHAYMKSLELIEENTFDMYCLIYQLLQEVYHSCMLSTLCFLYTSGFFGIVMSCLEALSTLRQLLIEVSTNVCFGRISWHCI